MIPTRSTTKPVPLISQHPKAPLFERGDSNQVLQQLISEVSSGSFPDSESFRTFFRQAGLVSLWFFAKFIAGFAGPYDRLNADLHLSMCNFRQSCLPKGSRAAMFLPRGVGKTKVVTETGSGWEGIRNGDITIRISNQIADYSRDFMQSVKAIFDSNELFAWLYPECVPERNQKRWNDSEIVFPHRRKHQREASIETGGIGGSSESRHVDLHIVDDPIGEKALNSNLQSNAIMETTKHWFNLSDPSLLNSAIESRVLVVGTRWAVDDLYDEIIKNARSIEGYPIKGIKPKENGKWRVYYRKILEDGMITYPEAHNMQTLKELAEKDWWTYVTQYMNDPQQAGLAEFIKYIIQPAEMSFRGDEWFVEWTGKDEQPEQQQNRVAV